MQEDTRSLYCGCNYTKHVSYFSSSDTQEMLYAPVATQRIALGTVKSTGGDYSSETFSDIHLKLEFELVFLNLPRV